MAILNNHTDGGCFKLTITYTDFEDSSPFELEIKYCEDFSELIIYSLKRINYYTNERDLHILDFRIQDDSK